MFKCTLPDDLFDNMPPFLPPPLNGVTFVTYVNADVVSSAQSKDCRILVTSEAKRNTIKEKIRFLFEGPHAVIEDLSVDDFVQENFVTNKSEPFKGTLIKVDKIHKKLVRATFYQLAELKFYVDSNVQENFANLMVSVFTCFQYDFPSSIKGSFRREFLLWLNMCTNSDLTNLVQQITKANLFKYQRSYS